ncbi:MAG: hypothetical protein WAL59_07670 [Roseiarcus sp.]
MNFPHVRIGRARATVASKQVDPVFDVLGLAQLADDAENCEAVWMMGMLPI